MSTNVDGVPATHSSQSMFLLLSLICLLIWPYCVKVVMTVVSFGIAL